MVIDPTWPKHILQVNPRYLTRKPARSLARKTCQAVFATGVTSWRCCAHVAANNRNTWRLTNCITGDLIIGLLQMFWSATIHACYHIIPFITIIFLPAGSAAQFAPGAGGIKLSCALSTSSPHNHHMLPQHIIHHYSHYQVGDHSFNLCEFSSHAIPTTVKSIILVSFQKHTGLGSKPFFASIATMNIVSLVVFWGTVTISL